jgi:O-antigen ligase
MVFFFLNINSILELVVKARGWYSFNDFLDDRVLGEQSIEYGNIGNVQLKDGYRFVMWEDLISRTFDDPITGIGMGSRALENKGDFVEDHNIFVTHISRYGIPLFFLWMWLVLLVIKSLRNYIKTNSFSKVFLYIITIMYINFFFQASVGNIWGQLLVVILIGTSIGLMLYNSKKIDSK